MAPFYRPLLALFLAFYPWVSRVQAACVQNCDNDPVTCLVTRAAVGTNTANLTNPQNVDAGRTSSNFFQITYTHDGGSGSYTVVPQADTDDAGIPLTTTLCDGRVASLFKRAGRKSVRVQVTQSIAGRTAQSQNAVTVVYDNVPPVLTLSGIILGTNANGPQTPFSAGTTIHTSDTLFVVGRIADPEPSQDVNALSVLIADGLSTSGAPVPVTSGSNGTFTLPLNLNQERDGEYNVQLRALDAPGLTLADGSQANRSEPRTIKVVKDTAKPVMTKLEIISGPDNAKKVAEVPRVFVQGGAQIRVRATFNEPLKVAPTLTLEHVGNNAGEPSNPYTVPFDSQLFASKPDQVEYEFTPLFDVRNLGPVNFIFGAGANATSATQAGQDLAGNEPDQTQGVLKNQGKVDAAIVVDGQAPSLLRLTGAAGEIQSSPRNNQTIARQNFPKFITLNVQDYNVPANIPGAAQASQDVTAAFDNASGVDFDKVNTVDLRVEVKRPDGTVIPGTLSTQPPSGLLYTLPDVEDIFTGQTQTGNPDDVNKPDAGPYTVTVTLIDKVGNKSTETIVFNMDVDAINASTIQVSLKPDPNASGNVNTSLKNPIKGTEIPAQPFSIDLATLDSVNQLESFELCSTDSTFSVSRSTILLKARLNGPDTVGRSMVVTGTQEATGTNTCGTTGKGQFSIVKEQQKTVFPELTFDFPNPSQPGQFVKPGQRDPRYGQYDGPYFVEVTAVDAPGNISKPINKEFLLDTTPPYTERTFPESNGKINTPLRHVSAVVVDPSPPRLHTTEQDGKVNFGSGISIRSSKINLRLSRPYKDSVDPNLFGQNNLLQGVLDFTHNPNAFDPELPTFNPNDDAYRVLLEFIDNKAQTITLPVDGSADGIYVMEVIPVDNAGNTIDTALAGAGGFNTQITNEADRPKELRKEFRFLLDTVAPNFTISPIGAATNPPTELNVNGSTFELRGKVRDLSARVPAESAIQGGSGMAKVEYSLVLLKLDGVPVDSQPAQGDNGKAKNNPILKDLVGELSPILDKSLDPSVSSSRPLTDGYGDLRMVEHDWVIRGTLPPADELITAGDVPANYVLVMKAYDHAGNFTERRLVMNLNPGLLPPPSELVAPALNASLKSPAVVFEWKPVEKAAEYILNLSQPNGQVVTFAVVKSSDHPNVRWNQILSMQGDYEWWVISVDSVGNLGQKGLNSKFRYDKDAPFVETMTWSDLSPDANPRLGIGTFKMQITFNEDILKGPRVFFRTLNVSVPEQLVVTHRLSGRVWEGVATIPTTATNLWDGKATIDIDRAQDKAGNTMIVNRNYEFVIDTGPSYTVKYFENPVYRSEIVLAVKATENLLNTPVITEPLGVSLAGTSMLRVSDSVFAANMRITATNNVQGQLRISGTDLDGNTASRVLTFPIVVVTKASQSVLKVNNLEILVEPESVVEPQVLALLPGPEFTELSVSASVGTTGVQTSPELVRIRDLEMIAPGDVQFVRPLKLLPAMRLKLEPQQGLFLARGTELEYLEPSEENGRQAFSISGGGQLMIMQDSKAPDIVIDNALVQDGISQNSPIIRFKAADAGSGLKSDSLRVILAGQEMAFHELKNDGTYVYRMQGKIPGGSNEVQIEASDRLGNYSLLKSTLEVQGPIRVTAISYPNPATRFSVVRYDLSRAAEHVELRIYDAAGAVIHSLNSSQDATLSLNRGENTWRWDLMDRRGRQVANGVYFAQIVAKDRDGHQDRQRIRMAVLQ